MFSHIIISYVAPLWLVGYIGLHILQLASYTYVSLFQDGVVFTFSPLYNAIKGSGYKSLS